MRPRTCGARGRATSSCSCRASARSARRRSCCARDSRGARTRARSRSCRCIARLSVDEQQRVFAPSRGRRIVLATNVAETSLTVPGIRYVIDTGLARDQALLGAQQDDAAADREDRRRRRRTSARAAAAASQDGVCVRLYGEDDFAARPAYTDPEILRSSLAAVILQMAALELGDVEAFPFLEPPTPRAIADGYQLLQELGAVDASARADAARPRARATAARPAHRPHACSRRATRIASPRCWSSRARCRCPIRASGRSRERRRPTRRTCDSATSARISCR